MKTTTKRHANPRAVLTASIALLSFVSMGVGCDAPNSEAALRGAWKAMQVAFVDRDSRAFCALFTRATHEDWADLADRSNKQTSNACKSLFDEVFVKFRDEAVAAKLLRVHVSGNTGQTLDSGGDGVPAYWLREDGQWRSDGVGYFG